MSIHFSCPECGSRLKVDASHGGRRVRCTKCRSVIVVPQPAAATAPAHAVEPAYVHEPTILRLRRASEEGEDEIDMTPMIDVVFQLLIFFMVTAAFALQKSLPVPPPEQTDTVAQAPAEPTDDDLVTVRVDADDGLWVDGALAVSAQDLIAKLRKARASNTVGGPGRRRLLVLADPDSRHEAVVTALDAGSAAGMEEVALATDEDA